MADWLHFIGRSLYGTPNRFATEAAKLGAQRRVTTAQMKAMRWGDRVYCAMLDKDNRTVVFGYFTVDRIAAETSIAEIIQSEFPMTKLTKIDTPPNVISRACGSYGIGAGFVMSNAPSLRQLADKLTNGQKPMVAGPFTKIRPFILADHKQGLGFHHIDGQAMEAARDASPVKGKALPVLSGNFRPLMTPAGAAIKSAQIIQLSDYQRLK